MEETTEVSLGRVKTSYGIFIDIQGNIEDIAKALTVDADRTVEIAVRFKDEVREYTLANFLERLGY
jgi:hypothetical protein